MIRTRHAQPHLQRTTTHLCGFRQLPLRVQHARKVARRSKRTGMLRPQHAPPHVSAACGVQAKCRLTERASRQQAKDTTGADASVIFVPPPVAGLAMMEAIPISKTHKLLLKT